MTQTGNLELIKRLNRSLVLDLIRNEQPITRAAIAKRLNLSRSTVSMIVEKLVSKKMVIEIGLGSSTLEGGRPGMQLGFNPKSAYGVGVDIGGTKILILITDLDGEVVYKEKISSSKDLTRTIQLIQSSIQKSKIPNDKIIGMGVGIPAIINTREGIVIDSPQLQWKNVAIKEAFEQTFSFPVFFENDVNCGALGERWLGSGKDSENVTYISIGTGVGSAIIANGELVQGHHYSAGEVAYFVDKADVLGGFKNIEGKPGLFESKTSGTALTTDNQTSEELFERFKKGDARAAARLDEFVLDLSIVIANIISFLNPEKVIIGGGVANAMDSLLEKIQDTVNSLTPIRAEISLSKLKGEAGGFGALALAFEKVKNQL